MNGFSSVYLHHYQTREQVLLKGVLWDFVGKGAHQIVSFVISIILARILGPEAFGLLGMAMVVIGIAQVFGDFGFSSGVIQAKEVTAVQYNTIFWINVIFGLVLSALTFFSAALVTWFYESEEVGNVFRSLSPIFLLGSFSVLPLAILKRQVNFKSIAIINFIAVIIAGATGLTLAYSDYGVYALVAQSLIQYAILSIAAWFFVDWRPVLNYATHFDLKSIGDIWKFSSNLFYSSLLDAVVTRLDVLIIGKLFSAATIGFYTRAVSFYNLIVRYSSSSLAQVFFPVISKIQDDKEAVRQLTLKSVHVVSFAIFLLIGATYLVSDEVFLVLLSAEWLEASAYFKIILLSAYSRPLGATMVNVLIGLGNSKTHLKIEVVKKFLLFLAYLVGFQFGLIGFLYSLIFSRAISTVINVIFASRAMGMRFTVFIVAILKYAILGAVTYFAVRLAIDSLGDLEGVIVQLLLKGSLFVLVYFALNYVVKMPGLEVLLSLVKRLKNRV
mgnify:CR=1 FL=1